MSKEIEVDSSSFDRLIMRVMAESGEPVAASVVTDDPEAQKYWHVLENGSATGSKPWPDKGPRTVVRQGRVYSSQAPKGFVHKNVTRFIRYLKDAYLKRVKAKGAPLTRAELASAANEAAEQARNLIQAAAPKHTGKFARSIKIERATS